MIDRISLKSAAKAQIEGNIGVLFVMALVVFGINLVAWFLPVGGPVATWILAPAFGLSITKVYLDLAKGIKPVVSKIFEGFYDLWCAIKLTFFVGLFTALWSLLFVIPGIIKG